MYAATPHPFHSFFYLLKYPRERFENANICISPTFQETVGSHLKPSLPVVVMATLNQFNSNLFCDFSKQYSTCKNITRHQYIRWPTSVTATTNVHGKIQLTQSHGKIQLTHGKIQLTHGKTKLTSRQNKIK